MFGAAPIERSSLMSSQKSKSPSPSTSMTMARSEKELTQLLMSGSSTEHLTLTRSGSAGQLGLTSSTPVTPDVASVHAPLMSPSMRQPVENTQRGNLHMLCIIHSNLFDFFHFVQPAYISAVCHTKEKL